MEANLEDFKTGWFGLQVGLKAQEIDQIIDLLKQVKNRELDHFHARSDFNDPREGIGDIEFYLAGNDAKHNLSLDETQPIDPSPS